MTLHFYLGTSAGFTSGTDLGNTSVRLAELPGFTEAADGGAISFSGLPFDDPTDSLGLVGLRPFWVEETAASPVRVWTGYVADRTFSRDARRSQIVGAANVTDPNLVDLNAIANIRIIAFNDGLRPQEAVTARLAWILGTTYLPVYDNGQVAASTGVTMDATDYRGQYPVDVLNDCAAASDRNWFIYWDPAQSSGHEIGLYFHHLGFTTGFTSSIRLTNHLADIDSTTTFGASATLNRDPSGTYSSVWMPYDGGHVYHTRSTTATAFIARHAVAPALKTKSRTKAASRAETFLDNSASEFDTISVTAILPRAKVNSALIGRSIDVKFDHLPTYASGYTSLQITRRTVRQMPDPNFYQVDFELANPKVKGGGGGSSVVDPKPFVPDCTPGGLDTATSLLTGKTIVADFITTAVYQPVNVSRVNDGLSDQTTAPLSRSPSGVDPDGSGIWKVDLGAAQSVGGFGVSVLACSVHMFLDWSDDNSSWTNISESDGDEGGFGEKGYIHIFTFTAVSHRYWRLRYTHSGGGFRCGADVFEWELYGTEDDCNEPQVGQPVPPETPGSTTDAILCYTTNYPYLPGSLHVTVNGLPVIVDETSPTTGGWCLTQHYPPGAVINTSYQAASPESTGVSNPDAAPVNTPALPVSTAKGDMIAGDGTLWRRLAVGSNGSILMADSTSGVGVKWANSSNFSGGGGGGVTAITANGSNSLAGTVNLKAGTGIALGVSGQDITITNTGSSGGVGGGSSDAILGIAGAGGARISGLQGSPDVTVGGGSDKEFDSSTLGGTAVGSLTTEDADTTRRGHYYQKMNATASFGLVGRIWTPPSTPYTVTAKLSDATMAAQFHRIGMAVTEASPGKTAGIYHEYNTSSIRAISTITSTSPTAGAAYRNEGVSVGNIHIQCPLYFRIIVVSSTDITFQFSTGGMTFRTHGAANYNPGFTIGGIGLFADPENSSINLEAFWDWLRFT